MAQRVKAAAANIIGTAFEEGGFKVEVQNLAKVFDIFADELVLQVDGVGRDDDAVLVLYRPMNRGQEVRKRFANAGPGFDQ